MVSAKKIVIYVFAILVAIWSLIPVYWFLNLSFMADVEVSSIPPHFYPHQPIIANYLRILGFSATAKIGDQDLTFRPSGYADAIKRGIANSLILASVVTVITVVVATISGYAFGRFRFRFKNHLLLLLLLTRALPPISILVPYFFLYQVLGLHGTLHGLVIIYLSVTLPIITWILMGFFATLPWDVEKAARVDGCTRLQALVRVIIPMGSAGIATTAILTFLLSWNEFLFAWLLTAGTPAQTLPPVFPAMLFHIIDNTGLAAATIVSLIPPIAIAVLFGRSIVKLKIVDPVTTVGE